MLGGTAVEDTDCRWTFARMSLQRSRRSARLPLPENGWVGLRRASGVMKPDRALPGAGAGVTVSALKHLGVPTVAEKSKGYLRHVALSVADPWETAEFYKQTVGLEEVTERFHRGGEAAT